MRHLAQLLCILVLSLFSLLGTAEAKGLSRSNGDQQIDSQVQTGDLPHARRPSRRSPRYTPVELPNGDVLPLRDVDGVKVGHLVAQSFVHEFAPGLRAHVWGYNGGVPGPTIDRKSTRLNSVM